MSDKWKIYSICLKIGVLYIQNENLMGGRGGVLI